MPGFWQYKATIITTTMIVSKTFTSEYITDVLQAAADFTATNACGQVESMTSTVDHNRGDAQYYSLTLKYWKESPAIDKESDGSVTNADVIANPEYHIDRLTERLKQETGQQVMKWGNNAEEVIYLTVGGVDYDIDLTPHDAQFDVELIVADFLDYCKVRNAGNE